MNSFTGTGHDNLPTEKTLNRVNTKRTKVFSRVLWTVLMVAICTAVLPLLLLVVVVFRAKDFDSSTRLARLGQGYSNAMSRLCGGFTQYPVVGPLSENCRLASLASETVFGTSQELLISLNELGLIGERGVVGSEDSTKNSLLATEVAHAYRQITALKTNAAASSSWTGKAITKIFSGPAVAGWYDDLGGVSQFIYHLPYLSGESKPSSYAVVFSNTFHQTPSGGEFDSGVIVTLSNGKIVDMNSFTADQVDSHLTGQVSLPNEYANYLRGVSGGLTTSTWHTNFASTAGDITNLLKASLGVDVDGVVLVDISALNQLLGAVGPTEVPSRGRIVSQVSGDDTPLSDVAKAMLATTSNLDGKSRLKFVQTLYQLLEQKHVAVHIPLVQRQLGELGWSGELSAEECGQNCFTDEVSVVDAVLTQQDVQITKTLYLHSSLSADVLNESMTITYLPTDVGESQVLSQIILPKDSQVGPVQLLTDAESRVLEPTIHTSSDTTQKLAQVLVKLSSTSPVSLTVTWQRPVYVDLTKTGMYKLTLTKQIGTMMDDVYMQLDLPENLLVGKWNANMLGDASALDKHNWIGYNSRRVSKYTYAGTLQKDLVLTNFWAPN